jgi:hypothetical protein
MPDAAPLGETFLDASVRAIVGASFVNKPSGGKVETVLTFDTQRLGLFVVFRRAPVAVDFFLIAMFTPS